MQHNSLLPWIVVGAGLFSNCGAAFDWDWFMESRKAQLWLKLFGRQGTRIFFGVLGLVMVTTGLLVVTGVFA